MNYKVNLPTESKRQDDAVPVVRVTYTGRGASHAGDHTVAETATSMLRDTYSAQSKKRGPLMSDGSGVAPSLEGYKREYQRDTSVPINYRPRAASYNGVTSEELQSEIEELQSQAKEAKNQKNLTYTNDRNVIRDYYDGTESEILDDGEYQFQNTALDMLRKKIGEKKSNLQQTKYLEWMDTKNAEGFNGTYDANVDDDFYQAVNGNVKSARGAERSKLLQYMTDDEKSVYNYLYSTQGKDKANEFVNDITPYLTKENRRVATENAAELAYEHPVAASGLSVVAGLAKPLEAIAQTVDLAVDGNIDQNNYLLSNFTSTVQDTVSNKIKEDLGSGVWGEVGSFLYGTGMSMANFLTQNLVAGAIAPQAQVAEWISLGLMGSGAMADAVVEAKDRGLSDGQAYSTGLVAGLAEILTEKVSIDALLDADLLSDSKIKYILKNTLSEGSEEVGSDVINTMADLIINGDKAEWRQAINEYVAQGMSEKEAYAKVLGEQAMQTGLDFLGGALSGGVMSTAQSIRPFSYFKQTGEKFSDAESKQAVIDEGLAMPEGTKANELAKKYSSATPTNTQIGQMVAANEEYLSSQREGVKEFSDTLGDAGKTAMQKLYNDGDRADTYVNDFNRVYNEGKNGTTAVDGLELGSLNEAQAKAALLAGNADNVKEALNGGEGSVSEGGERNAVQSADIESGSVQEAAGGLKAGQINSNARDAEAVKISLGQAVTAKSFGISNGTEDSTVYEVHEASYTATTKKAAEECAKNGVKFVAFAGGNLSVMENGKLQKDVRGLYDPETNTVYCRVDDATANSYQIMKHEMFHDRVNKGEVNIHESRLETEKKMKQIGKFNEFDKVLKTYFEIYGTEDADYVFEEIMADANGDMNIFDALPAQKAKSSVVYTAAKMSEVKGEQNKTRGAPQTSPRLSVTPSDSGIRTSIASLSQSMGVVATRSDEGKVLFSTDHVTEESIKEKSGIGFLIKTAVAKGNITEAEANKQYKAAAKLMNMIIETEDPEMIWAFAGSEIFSALKANSDGQYGTTIDFTTVCRKTQDMVTAMSSAMKKLERGLTKAEVTELQKKLVGEGMNVPCPVCYVFSRWAGVGGMLDDIAKLQDMYSGYTKGELKAALKALDPQIDNVLAKNKEALKGTKTARRSSAINELKSIKNERYSDIDRELEVLRMGKQTDETKKRISDLEAEMKAVDMDRNILNKYTWVANIVTDKDYKPVPKDILFDLNKGAEFAKDYPVVWKYRTTRGPSSGKAIMPYSDMRLGDIITGVKSNSATGNTLFKGPYESWSAKDDKKRSAAINNAIKRTKAQNLIGGQRFQSTSDFRYEYALDYIQALWELQALGSTMQTYTKIVEFADFVAAVGGDVNLSVMPFGKGYKDGKLVFSNVTGMNIDAAREANRKFDSAQLILVGINDEHIKLALRDSAETGGNEIGFVIPYHASGASIQDFISELVSNLGEKFVTSNYQSYEDVQTDHKRADSTGKQDRMREIRKKILTSGKALNSADLEIIQGKSVDITGRSFKELRDIEDKALKGDKAAIKEYTSWTAGALLDMYNRLQEDPVKLSSTQAEAVMPHEYWNKSTTRENAYINGILFRSYCYNLGLHPRFTGHTSTGMADHGNFINEEGYWKTLIDRAMYNNDGTYRDQNKINLTDFNLEMLTPEYAKKTYPDYKVAEPSAEKASRIGNEYAGTKMSKAVDAKYSKGATSFNRPSIEAALWESLDHNDNGNDNLIRVSEMPNYISQKIGISGDIYLYRDHVYENMVSREQAEADGRPTKRGGKNIDFHNLGIEKTADAIYAINSPTMAIAGKGKDGNPIVTMILSEFGNNGAPLYATLSFYSNKPINGRFDIKPHIVLSIAERPYFNSDGRDGYVDIVARAIENGSVIDFDYNKRDDLSVIANQARVGNITTSSLEHNLSQFKKEVNDFKRKNNIRYSLSPVAPVNPSDNLWSPSLTTDEVMKVYPDLWNVAADESETRNPTQITSTVKTYRKIYDILKSEGFDGRILDASSGLGYGTRAGIDEYGFDVDDIEPFPDKDYSPKYTDYSTLDETYDAIISNAVLNVLPRDQRDALVVKMGEMLNPNGRMFINVRSLAEIQALQKTVDSKTGERKNVTLSNSEVAETTHGSYQKGFTRNELKAYLEDALGDGYTVEKTNEFGGTSVVVTKKTDASAPARYSRAYSAKSLEQDYADLEELYKAFKDVQNEARRQGWRAEYWKGQTKTTERTMTDASVKRALNKVLKDYDSTLTEAEVHDRFKKIASEAVISKDFKNVLQGESLELARDIVQNASAIMNTDEVKTWNELKQTLKNTTFYVDKSTADDIADFDEWRKTSGMRIRYADKYHPQNVDTVYQNLSSTYGEWMINTEDIATPSDELLNIKAVLDSLAPVYDNPNSMDMAEAIESCAYDLARAVFDGTVRETPRTFADKQKEKYDKLREEKNARIEETRKEGIEKARVAAERAREVRERQIARLKDTFNKRLDNMSERKKCQELRGKIFKHVKNVSDLYKATDKKHIPHYMKEPVSAILEAINGESKNHKDTARTRAFIKLREMYREYAGDVVVDPEILGNEEAAGYLQEVIDMGDTPLYNMNSEQLYKVYRVILATETAIRNANKLFNAEKMERVSEIADGLRDENIGKTPKTMLAGIIGKFQSLSTLDMLTPQAYFHMLGNTGDYIFKMMRQSQDKQTTLIKEAQDYSDGFMRGVNTRKLEREMHTVELGNEKTEMSTAQIMELYVLMRREASLEHLIKGGIYLEERKTVGIKRKVSFRVIRNVTQKQLNAVTGMLTDQQKTCAELMQDFLSTRVSEWGNEASMLVYGYEKFGEKFYWPIRSYSADLKQTETSGGATLPANVSGKGFTKALTPHANTSVKIGSIFDTYTSHIADMATYSAWLATCEDLNRVRNYKYWVKQEDGSYKRDTQIAEVIDSVFGEGGSNYWHNLMVDISNKTTAKRTDYDSALTGAFKASAIGANLRVIIQQPTAILRALDMMSEGYMASSVVKNPFKGWRTAKKYAPIAQWKDWGYFDISTGRQIKDIILGSDSALEKTKSAMMVGAGWADSVAWGFLWNSCENEVRDKTKLTSADGDKFYKAVAERFGEIIDRTQVVDGTLQRSQIMRDTDKLTKMATSFLSEPMKQYNMLLQSAYDAKTKKTLASKKRLFRTAYAFLLAGLTNAFAQSVIDAMRNDDKDKDFWERLLNKWRGEYEDAETDKDKFEAFMNSNIGDMMNPMNYFPYIKDVVSLIQGYDVSRMDMESISKIIQNGQYLHKAMDGDSKYTKLSAAINFASALAGAIGIPVANLNRDAWSLVGELADSTGNYVLRYEMAKMSRNSSNATAKSSYINILYEAAQKDPEAYERIYDDMVANDMFATASKSSADVINDALNSKAKKEGGEAFFTPEQTTQYRDVMTSSDLYKSASEDEKTRAVTALRKMLGETDTAAAEKAGVSNTDLTLYVMALTMADKPTASGNYGSYKMDEVAEAIRNTPGLTEKDKRYLFTTVAGYSEKNFDKYFK